MRARAVQCHLSLNDLCDRPPRPLADGEVLDIGSRLLHRQVRQINTQHVPSPGDHCYRGLTPGMPQPGG